jgi:aldehyde dehydrogenase (NAD+)
VHPALLEGPDDNICYGEELFGPCAYLLRFKDEESAIAQASKLAYGLANSVRRADLRRANPVAERMVAGNSWIDPHNLFAYGMPYGGVNLSGVTGGVNSPETFYDYLCSQIIARRLNSCAKPSNFLRCCAAMVTSVTCRPDLRR